MADYMSVVTAVAPIATVVVGYFGKRALDLKPRVVAFMASANSVVMGKGLETETTINSHVLIIRNDGGLAARNVRITHDHFPPNISVYPGVEYVPFENPQGFTELQFPLLAPGQQISVSYMYFPPLIWPQINCDVYSETGRAERVALLPRPRPARWIVVLRSALMFLGGWGVIYWIAKFVYAVATKTPLFGIGI